MRLQQVEDMDEDQTREDTGPVDLGHEWDPFFHEDMFGYLVGIGDNARDFTRTMSDEKKAAVEAGKCPF